MSKSKLTESETSYCHFSHLKYGRFLFPPFLSKISSKRGFGEPSGGISLSLLPSWNCSKLLFSCSRFYMLLSLVLFICYSLQRWASYVERSFSSGVRTVMPHWTQKCRSSDKPVFHKRTYTSLSFNSPSMTVCWRKEFYWVHAFMVRVTVYLLSVKWLYNRTAQLKPYNSIFYSWIIDKIIYLKMGKKL